MTIPYHISTISDDDSKLIADIIKQNRIDTLGEYTKKCQQWLEENCQSKQVLLTHSCTAALEISAILADIQPGDEIIMPSYTFVSTASAFVLRGGVPVFVDIRTDNFNIDENLIETAITEKTKAIVPMHYAAVGCDMDKILAIAAKHNLLVIEDAAQCLGASYKEKPLGSMGNLGTFSFHHTKNITSGQGGALLINDEKLLDRAHIILQKGTNRQAFLQGHVDKYTWVDLGSSFTMSEINAALLWSQLQQEKAITQARLALWQQYYDGFSDLEAAGKLTRPAGFEDCKHNAHIFYFLLPDADQRGEFMQKMRAKGIQTIFHYVPLHQSPAGQKFGRVHGSMSNTEALSSRLVRLPLWVGLDDQMQFIIDSVHELLGA